MGDVVKDFYKSDAPQFKGRSKEKRREMAIAAKLTAERGKLPEEVETVDEMFGGSSSGGRADRGDEVGRKERVKRAQEAKAKRLAVKDTPIDKYKPSPGMARYLAKMKKEEVEVVNEVSKKTLGSYVKKASTDLATRSIKHGMTGGTETGGDPDSSENVEKINKRRSGIMKAVDKLKKESFSANPAQQAAIAIAKKERKQVARKCYANGASGIEHAH